jgi:hypothetical protein
MYPINLGLEVLLKNIMTESRWDLIYLGMQVIVEGLALAAFRLANTAFSDPLIVQITDLVARDEARHVAFGDLALRGLYPQMTAAELHDRDEFLKEATLLMGRRFLLEDVWSRLGIDRARGMEFASTNASMLAFRQVLFARVFSSLSKLGLMTPSLRRHVAELSLVRVTQH